MKNSDNCNLIKNIGKPLLTCFYFSVYFSLWSRQRSFYVKKQTRHLTTSITRFLSSICFVWLCLNELGNPVLLLTLVKYEKHQGKPLCGAVKGKDNEGGILYSLSRSVIALNLLITTLLAHPILNSRATIVTSKNDTDGSSSDGKVLAVIKRSFVIAMLIIIVDTFSFLNSQ